MQGPDMVTVIINGLIKPSMLILLLFILYFFLRNSSAALKHFCLLMGLMSLLILPVSAFLIPDMAWDFPLSEALFRNLPFSWQEYLLKTSYTPIEPIWWESLVVIYLLGSTSILFFFLIGFIQVWNIYRKSTLVMDLETLDLATEIRHLYDINRQVKLVSSNQLSSPCIWGIWQPKILMPQTYKNWTYEQKVSVLMHELGHIHRFDSLSLLIVKLACSIFWFLLPVWWMAAKISKASEIACDDLIYRLSNKQVKYAEHLLQLANHSNTTSSSVVPMSGHSEIYHRIMAVLDIQRPRQAVKSESIQYPLVIGMLFIALLASLDRINFNPIKNNPSNPFSTFSLAWAKVAEATVADENILQAEKTLLMVDRMESQPRPVLITRTIPLAEKFNAEIKDEYKSISEIDKTSLQKLISYDSNKTEKSISSDLSEYKVIQSILPVYPEVALKKGIMGNVKVKFFLDENGTPVDIQVVESNPAGIFDQSAINAISQSQFEWIQKQKSRSPILQQFIFQLDTRRKRRP